MQRSMILAFLLLLTASVVACAGERSAADSGVDSDTTGADAATGHDTWTMPDMREACHGVPIDDPNHRCSQEGSALGLPDVPDGRFAFQGCQDPELSQEDSDGDGLPNFEEDINGNCRQDLGETNWLDPDSNDDGIPDGMDPADIDHGRACPRDMPQCMDGMHGR